MIFHDKIRKKDDNNSTGFWLPLYILTRDRCRTTNNMLGDAYGAAIVEALSK